MEIKPFEDLQQAELTLSFVGQRISVSIYLIDGLLIDTGPANKKTELISLFETWNMTEVILTHHHEDHTGMGHWIQENKNIPIYIHEKGMNECINPMKLPLYRKVFWGERAPFQLRALGNTYHTSHYSWDVIHTPGHAHDHVALYNREKSWMFGGDLYVQATPKSMFTFESVPQLIESLRKVLTYDFDTYICSHAGILPKGRQAIERKLHYLVGLEQEVLFLYRKGWSPREIRKTMFPKVHPIQYLSFFENSPLHMIHSIIKRDDCNAESKKIERKPK